jgi:hypothetical protein
MLTTAATPTTLMRHYDTANHWAATELHALVAEPITLSNEAFDALVGDMDSPPEVIEALRARLPQSETPYIDQINAARRVYAASPKRIGDWCDYLAVVEALRVRFGR